MLAQRRNRAVWPGIIAVGVVAALMGLGGWRTESASAQAPTFSLAPASQTVALGAGTVQFDVHVDNVTGMAAFGFLLRYDAGVLKNPVVAQGPFLATSGKSPICPAPEIDIPQKGPGTLQYGCGTSGQGQGADGSGVVATVTFTLAGGSSTVINVESASVTDDLGSSLCGGACAGSGGSVNVTGGDSSKNQGLSAAPTPVPQESGNTSPTSVAGQPTATPASSGEATPVADAATPPSGTVAGASGGSASAGGGSAGGGVATGASGGAGTSGSSPGVGRLGTGTAQRHRGGSTLVLTLALAGAVLLPAGLLAKRRAVR